jgi:glycosyltransferase involved in cell wall biosynthesis
MKNISILVPCYNEEKSLPLFYPEVKKVIDSEHNYEWEILFVNDGSKDNTLSIIKALRAADNQISYVNLSRNFGKEKAMLAGFDYAIGDCVIIMDADLQDPPSLIPEMLRYWEQGFKDVYAKRKNRGRESWIRKKFSLLFYKILSHTTRFDVLQNVGDFRLLDRQCVEALKRIRETERYTKGLFCWIGYEKKEITFDRKDRIAGKSNWNFWSLFDLAIEGITSFTTAPLRIATIGGVFIALVAFIFMLYYIGKTLLYGDPVQGFTTLVSILLFMSGVILLAIGVLGEYVGRIFNETKNRPTYLASEYNERIIV